MKNTIIYKILIPFLAFTATSGIAEEYIKIASFNIAEFGESNHPDTRDLDYIADLLRSQDLDLIALQEVGTVENGEKQVTKLVKKMNEKLNSGESHYFPFISPKTGDERYAFIFRFPVILEDDHVWLDKFQDPTDPSEGGKKYYRIPYAVAFKANDFDFYIVNMHLSWGDLQKRTMELKALRKYLLKNNEGEDDWILLGDMNRYGKYAKSKKKAFDQLLKGNWKSYYRFPLLEAITEPDDMKVYRAAEDKYSTTVAKGKNIYDQIIITEGAFHEFGIEDSVLGEDVGIVAFDMEPPFKDMSDHNEVKYRVSDHRPIWIRMRIDFPDDD